MKPERKPYYLDNLEKLEGVSSKKKLCWLEDRAHGESMSDEEWLCYSYEWEMSLYGHIREL